MPQPYHTTDGKVRIRLTTQRNAPYPRGEVLDAGLRVIGEANSYTYGGAAFAVHTPQFAGYVSFGECVFVGGSKGILAS